ncbi:MAG: hypothetical protein WC864_06890 [Ilumatobacteraceae bacterium]
MIEYRANLAQYVASRKVIGMAFFSAAAEAEEKCDKFSKSIHTHAEQNQAQNEFKNKIRVAAVAHTASLEALGPPPKCQTDPETSNIHMKLTNLFHKVLVTIH